MKTVCLTFDYELFFGKSGTFENSIWQPTNSLIKIFENLNIKATFFIDIIYYQRLIEVNPDDGKLLREQLQLLVEKGHRIELHLHPHWIDAKYDKPFWIFPDYSHYRLQSLPSEKITDLIVSGSEILNEIADSVQKDYKVKAFRAGGWCVNPFDKLINGLNKCGIIIDSSVARGMKIAIYPFDVDFTDVPEVDWYKFESDPTKKDISGNFYEFPITTFEKRPIDKVIGRFLNYAQYHFDSSAFKIYGDGSSIPMEKDKNFNSFYSKLKSTYSFLSIEQIGPFLLNYNIKRSQRDLLNIMSHPKNISPSSLKCIEYLYRKNYSFSTLYDLLYKGEDRLKYCNTAN